MNSAPLVATELRRTYMGGDGEALDVLQGANLEIRHGEAVAIVGASGAGKSTLLHLLGGLDRPTSGSVSVGGTALEGLGDEDMAAVRNARIGFVFQFHHLLREFSALENVMMPALIAGTRRGDAENVARELLDAVGMSHRLEHESWQLSGGEQQRVAVARALVNDPVVLLADEPSGNLDARTSDQLHDLLFDLRERRSLSMVLVTHNRELAARTDRTVRLESGVLVPAEDDGRVAAV